MKRLIKISIFGLIFSPMIYSGNTAFFDPKRSFTIDNQAGIPINVYSEYVEEFFPGVNSKYRQQGHHESIEYSYPFDQAGNKVYFVLPNQQVTMSALKEGVVYKTLDVGGDHIIGKGMGGFSPAKIEINAFARPSIDRPGFFTPIPGKTYVVSLSGSKLIIK